MTTFSKRPSVTGRSVGLQSPFSACSTYSLSHRPPSWFPGAFLTPSHGSQKPSWLLPHLPVITSPQPTQLWAPAIWACGLRPWFTLQTAHYKLLHTLQVSTDTRTLSSKAPFLSTCETRMFVVSACRVDTGLNATSKPLAESPALRSPS